MSINRSIYLIIYIIFHFSFVMNFFNSENISVSITLKEKLLFLFIFVRHYSYIVSFQRLTWMIRRKLMRKNKQADRAGHLKMTTKKNMKNSYNVVYKKNLSTGGKKQHQRWFLDLFSPCQGCSKFFFERWCFLIQII